MALSKTAVTRMVDAGLAFGLVAALGVVMIVDAHRTPELAARGGPVRRGNLLGSIYELRTAPDKEKWIAQFGGTPQTEAAVQAGLSWLARHQAEGGSWSHACLGPKQANPQSRCEDDTPCSIPGQDYVMAQTGLALLALQAAGNYDFNANTYSPHVRRGLDWLIVHQGEDGALVGSRSPGLMDTLAALAAGGNQHYRHTFMYEHAIATFALAEACAVRKAQGEPADPRLRAAADKAVAFIVAQQHDDGGWRYSSNKNEGGDTSVSGWAMLALKSAVEAGIPVDRATIDRTREFFKSCETPNGQTSYTRGAGASTDALTAVGMLTHLLLLKEPTAPLVKTSGAYLAGRAESYGGQVRAGQAEFYTLYNATLAMQQAGGPDWDRWNDAVRDAVVANQSPGPGCTRGSWDPLGSHGGSEGGRIYSTALGTLMLEVYYRFSR